MYNINLKNMQLAYGAVYDNELRENFEEINDEFFNIEHLTEETLEEIAEEVIHELISEGYNFEDIESIFEEFIIEARVSYGHDTPKAASRLDKVKGALKGALSKVKDSMVKSQEKARKSAIKSTERANVRRDMVKGAVSGLRAKLKNKIGKVVSAAKAGVTSAKKELTGEAGSESKARITGYKMRKAARSQAVKTSQKDAFSKPSKVYEKPSDPWVGGSGVKPKTTPKGESASTSVKLLPPGRMTKTGKPFNKGNYNIQQSLQNRKLKQRLGEEVEAWINTLLDEGYDLSDYTWDDLYEEYERLQTMDESCDTYDIVLKYLLDEGFADTLDDAEVIMVNMSDNWKDSIIENVNLTK